MHWGGLPIIQAPIGSAAGIALCAAVSNAGGLGGLSLTWRDPVSAAALIGQVREATSRPFYANFVLHFDPDCLGAALDAGIPMVTFSWGDPGPYVRDVRSAGALLGLQVTSTESAHRMMEHEPDFLIVQGIEAGGHVQAHDSLDITLLEVLGAAGDYPVYAAGGLATGADLAHVMRIGAAGGVFGTRFLASTESEAHPEYKSTLTQSGSFETVLTSCFDGGWPQAPHRVLKNSTFVDWESHGCPGEGKRPGEGSVVGTTGSGIEIYRYDDAMPRIDTTGDWEAMCLYAGMSVDGIESVLGAAEIVARIWAEAQAAS